MDLTFIYQLCIFIVPNQQYWFTFYCQSWTSSEPEAHPSIARPWLFHCQSWTSSEAERQIHLSPELDCSTVRVGPPLKLRNTSTYCHTWIELEELTSPSRIWWWTLLEPLHQGTSAPSRRSASEIPKVVWRNIRWHNSTYFDKHDMEFLCTLFLNLFIQLFSRCNQFLWKLINPVQLLNLISFYQIC